jgi:hypothetical protein
LKEEITLSPGRGGKLADTLDDFCLAHGIAYEVGKADKRVCW